MKFLLNIQSWQGDIEQGMALARLIADLEPAYRDDVGILFTSRFDCKHDDETIAYVSKKFPCYKYTTKRKAIGWPNGPNQMMACSYEHCVEAWRRGKLPDLKAIMFIEADCVPLRSTWLNEIIAEFESCGKPFLGAWLKKGDAGSEHVNGNCVVAIDFFRKCSGMMHPPSRGGWDATLAYAILPNAAASRLIWSDYRLGTDDNPWKGCDYLWAPKRYGCSDNVYFGQDLFPCYYHGIKTMDGINCVRAKLFSKKEEIVLDAK